MAGTITSIFYPELEEKFSAGQAPVVTACVCTTPHQSTTPGLLTLLRLWEQQDWGIGCDAIFFSNVLHDWPEPQVQQLLKNARTALVAQPKKNSRIFLLEVLRNEDRNGPLMATLFHMQMQMAFGGAQYTRSDFVRLFKKAGFGPPKVVARFGYYSLLRANAV